LATAAKIPVVAPRRRPRRRALKILICAFALFYVLPVLISSIRYAVTGPHEHWSRADRSSAGLAPDPSKVQEALVHLYSARAHSWRGIFAVHTWFAFKPAGAKAWERLEVIGFGVNRGRPAVRGGPGVPDTKWFGSNPRLLRELRGKAAESAIARLRAAAAEYPYPKSYSAWPGPNSNTFIAYIGRRIPDLRLDLPATAIGKNYPVDGVIARAPSGTGWQISVGGLAGIMVGLEEGLELDIIGLAAGLDFNGPALRLPGLSD
jgi:hypothetical protein